MPSRRALLAAAPLLALAPAGSDLGSPTPPVRRQVGVAAGSRPARRPRPGHDTARAALRRPVDAAVARGLPAALLLARRGEQTWRYGRVRPDRSGPRRAITTATARFRAGSITKLVVAVVLLRLAEQGRVGLEDRVADWVPELPDTSGLTVRHLLSHRSGLPESDGALLGEVEGLAGLADALDELKFRSFDRRDRLELLATLPRVAPSGAGFSYANDNFTVAGLVAERAGADDLESLVWQHVFAPLGLRQSEFPDDDPQLRGPHLRGYVPVDGELDELVDVTEFSQSWPWAAGNLVTDADDLATLLRALTTGELLTPTSWRQARQAQPSPSIGGAYGLGVHRLRVDDAPVVGHFGAVPGYRSWAYGSLDGQQQLVVATALNPDPAGLGQAAFDQLARAFFAAA